MSGSVGSADPVNQQPLRVALLGAGIFASNTHAPVLQKNPDVFTTVAIWSRRQESAEKLAGVLNVPALSGDKGLEELLQRQDLDAVIMALPLDVQPEYVTKALECGKHVLSEKPIAATVKEAKQLVKDYNARYSNLRWSVAENYRYEPAIVRTADAIKSGAIGTPFMATLTIRAPFKPDNKFLNTPWRSSPSWYGGLFVDAFVHAAALLRFTMGEVEEVSAITSSQADYLPSVDTMTAQLKWENGMSGVVAVTYACQEMKFELEVVGTNGQLTLQRRQGQPGYRLVENGVEKIFGFGGIDAEFIAFANCVKDGGADSNTPEQALRDIALVEACLVSGKNSGSLTKVTISSD